MKQSANSVPFLDEEGRHPCSIDRAAHAAAHFHALALSSHQAKPNLSVGEQKTADGKVLCEDCEMEIPQARLQAVPGCIRCVTCQAAFEEET